MKKIDLTGKRFGRLIALESKSVSKKDRKRVFWKCICDCGKEVEVDSDALRNGRTKSCGCLKKEITRQRSLKHGYTVNRKAKKEYKAWQGAKNRCYNPKNKKYKNYGARGIRMCERWKHSFSNFIKDMGNCPENLTLDRINVDGNYEPKNCHWANYYIQARHRTDNVWITFNGITKIETDWAKEFKIDKRILNNWLKKGKTIQEIAKEVNYV